MLTDSRLSRTQRRPQGFTLVEAMVALVVLSIGLLGIAAMQLSSLRSSTSAGYRSIAAAKVSEIAERMRANLTGVDGGSYTVNKAPSCGECPDTACAPCWDEKTDKWEPAKSCDAANMATFDLYEVSCVDGVSDSLPAGDLSIAPDAASGGQAISITWQANVDFERQQDADEKSELTMTVIPGND